MARRKTTGKASRGEDDANDGAREWIGGVVPLPFFVSEPQPRRVRIAMWYEPARQAVLSFQLLDEEADTAAGLAGLLREALERPIVGERVRPDALRVESVAWGAALREVGGPGVEIRVAPTTELRDVAERMADFVEEHGDEGAELQGPSYFEDGRVPIELVRSVFEVGARMLEARPWERIGDEQIIRIDVPALGVDGAVISVIGALGESLGLVLFESREALAGLPDLDSMEQGEPLDLGSSPLAFELMLPDELPPSLVEEARKSDFKGGDGDRLPVVLRRDPDGVPRPNTAGDVRLASAAAAAIVDLVESRPSLFDDPIEEKVVFETVYTDARGALVVRLTADPAWWGEDDMGDDHLLFDGWPRFRFEAEEHPAAPADSISPALVDAALGHIERALALPRERRGLPVEHLAAVAGATLSARQRARAEALYERVYAARGVGGQDAEDLLLQLLGMTAPASTAPFWAGLLPRARARDTFATRRRTIGAVMLARLAITHGSAAARGVLLERLSSRDAAERNAAIVGIAHLIDGSAGPPAPDLVDALVAAATGAEDVRTRFRARRALERIERPIPVEEGTTITLRAAMGRFHVDLEVAADQPVARLGSAILDALGWDNDHLYAFFLDGTHRDQPDRRIEIGPDYDAMFDSEELAIGAIGLRPGDALEYLFDFGDMNLFALTVLAVDGKRRGRSKYPREVGRKGKPPKQYEMDW